MKARNFVSNFSRINIDDDDLEINIRNEIFSQKHTKILCFFNTNFC